jgi:hypothetical protein
MSLPKNRLPLFRDRRETLKDVREIFQSAAAATIAFDAGELFPDFRSHPLGNAPAVDQSWFRPTTRCKSLLHRS